MCWALAQFTEIRQAIAAPARIRGSTSSPGDQHIGSALCGGKQRRPKLHADDGGRNGLPGYAVSGTDDDRWHDLGWRPRKVAKHDERSSVVMLAFRRKAQRRERALLRVDVDLAGGHRVFAQEPLGRLTR